MRTINGNIKILADEDYANKKISFVICDGYGNPQSSLSLGGQIATKKTITTDIDGNFSVILYETNSATTSMFYKMKFIDNEDIDDIKLFIDKGDTPIDFLRLIFPTPDLKMFYEQTNDQITFKNIAIEVLDRFFVNENLFETPDQKRLVDEFIRYADGLKDSELMEELDKYLATIGV
jgi:hypothetical protein